MENHMSYLLLVVMSLYTKSMFDKKKSIFNVRFLYLKSDLRTGEKLYLPKTSTTRYGLNIL